MKATIELDDEEFEKYIKDRDASTYLSIIHSSFIERLRRIIKYDDMEKIKIALEETGIELNSTTATIIQDVASQICTIFCEEVEESGWKPE